MTDHELSTQKVCKSVQPLGKMSAIECRLRWWSHFLVHPASGYSKHAAAAAAAAVNDYY